METSPQARRGFAAMSPERRREISKLGGVSVPNEKRAFSRDRELAVKAGRKGGHSSMLRHRRQPPATREEDVPAAAANAGRDRGVVKVIQKVDGWYVLHDGLIGPFFARKTATDLAVVLVGALRQEGVPAGWYVASELPPSFVDRH